MSTDWKALCAELLPLASSCLCAEEMVDSAVKSIDRARATLAQPEPQGASDEEKWYPGFADWLEREMPEGTVIGDPLWWASKIADYLQRHGRPAIEPVPGAEVG